MIVIGSGVGEWVAKRIRSQYDERDSQALGWMEGDEITSGVIYEGYNQVSVIAHIACNKSLKRKFVWAIFDYPFRQLGVSKIICPVAEGNEESKKLCAHFGFTEEARIDDCHPSGGMIFYSMRKDQCRWIKDLNYGKR